MPQESAAESATRCRVYHFSPACNYTRQESPGYSYRAGKSDTPHVCYTSLAQNTAAHKASTTIQCRSLNGSSTPIQSDEQLIGDQICKSVPAPTTQTEVAATSPSATTTHPETAKPDTASTTDKPSPSVEQAPATIYFYRPRRFQGSALKPSVFVDDARSGQVHNGDSIKVFVPPGNHRIYSTDRSTGIELSAKSGQTYYVRVDI